MAQGRFSWFDVTLAIASLLTLLVDFGTDFAVGIQLCFGGSILWGSLVLVFTIVPIMVMNGVSLKWNATDGSLDCSWILPHIFLLAPLQRYLRVLWLGFKACLSGHPRFIDAALREQNDVCILRLFQTFLGSAPQLVLQLCIMLLSPKSTHWTQMLSAASSLVSLSWSLTVYSDTSRLNHCTVYSRRIAAFCAHWCWQLFMATARITSLVLFTCVLQTWLCLFAGLHWLIMTLWLWIKGTDFGKGKLERALFCCVSGYMYIFAYLNVREGPSRGRMTPYYCLIFLENGVLFAIWLIYGRPSADMKIVSTVLVFGGFLLGGLCLMMYYRWLHPSGPHYLFTVKSTVPQGYRSPKELRRQHHEDSAHSPPVFQEPILELSVETGTPSKGSVKTGDASMLSHLLGSGDRGALESAWQNGMNSSSSSSTSSLDADDCSLDAFNTTVKSANSTLKGQLQQVSPSSSGSTKSDHLDTCQPQPPVDLSSPVSSNSYDQVLDDSHKAEDLADHSPHSRNGEMSEVPKEQQTKSFMYVQDDGSQGRDLQKQIGNSPSKLSSSPTPAGSVSTFCKPLQLHASTPSSRALNKQSAGPVEAMSITKKPGGNSIQYLAHSQMISNVSQSKVVSQCSISSSSASDLVPGGPHTSYLEQLSQNFDHGESPILSPVCTQQISATHRPLSVSHDDGSLKRQNDAIAPYLDRAESVSSDLEQQKLYVDNTDGHMERTGGGESMWGASPNISNNSSSQSQDKEVILPPGVSHLPRLVDSFDSESEPICINNANLQRLQQSGNTSQGHTKLDENSRGQLKQTSQTASPAPDSPATNIYESDTSWNSMNVNENEWSGLNNLKALTPDDSLCSFASSDKGDIHKDGPRLTKQIRNDLPGSDTGDGIASRASTPSITRSHSTSSLYHEFSSAGVSPSPPSKVTAAKLLRNHSWMSSYSPSVSQNWHQAAHQLDHLNVDPAPPVQMDAYPSRYDPREVVIEMLMDQLKRTSFRSSFSLDRSYLRQSSPMFSPNLNASGQQTWRHFFTDPNASSLGTGVQGYRTDIDLMRRALDLIEMQRFSQRFESRAAVSESPEMYVSGQYRPPIVQNTGKTHAHPALRTQERSQSRLNASIRQAPNNHLSLPRQSPAFADSPYDSDRQLPTADHAHQCSLSDKQRDGLFRYFVDSDSPQHTPLWNTPFNTPAATPSTRLLRPTMSQNAAETCQKDLHLHSTESQAVYMPSSNPGEREDSSIQPHKQSIYVDRKPAAHRLLDNLEVETDHHDSGLHSGSHSAASRRQPLQSLDNSPSLSPSSLTQQPVQAKATAKISTAQIQRQSHGSTRYSSSGQPSRGLAYMGNQKVNSLPTKVPGQTYRQTNERNSGSGSITSSPQNSRRTGAKSVDRLR